MVPHHPSSLLSLPPPPPSLLRVFADRCGIIIDRVFLFGFGFQWIHYKGCPVSIGETPIIILAPPLLAMFAAGLYGVPTFVARSDVKDLCVGWT